jgi:spore maturation protein CgeB
MRVAVFCHSIRSDWNHGNAHFLRGVVWELRRRGHQVAVWEPEDGWSYRNLLLERGQLALAGFRHAYPGLDPVPYPPGGPDLERALDGVGLVLVHEWNDVDLVARLGAHRRRHGGYVLLFHDTHHRSVTDPAAMEAYDLSGYDGVLAFGRVVRDLYLARGWTKAAWIWHEAADVRLFRPMEGVSEEGDLVWIGNWGDEERSEELREFLLEPVRRLRLRARVYGVRYPGEAREELAAAGIGYGGYLPNHEVPSVFARYRVTVHVPRRPYARLLPGIPTIRPFEALACGIPLVSAPWEDAEGLFPPGVLRMARDGAEMCAHLQEVLQDGERAAAEARRGRACILSRHTCGHRVDALLRLVHGLTSAVPVEAS